MEELPLDRSGVRAGRVTLERRGCCVQVTASMDSPGDGLYRAFLLGERGELPLGVMEPANGALTLRRSFYLRELTALGTLSRGEARRSFSFSAERDWQRTDCPAQLLKDESLRRRAEALSAGWWRRERGVLLLALPLEEGRPFPLETLFCLARVERIEGVTAVVYRFDGEGRPSPPR